MEWNHTPGGIGNRIVTSPSCFFAHSSVYSSTCLSIEEGSNQMKPFSKMFLCASIGLATLAMGCAEMKPGATNGTGSSTSPSSNANISDINTGSSRVSTGTQGDTLEACLSRIPDNASDGQRMLATLSCERDARARTSIDAVPGS